jgi:hypothetical protein
MRHLIFYIILLVSYFSFGQAKITAYEYWIDSDLSTKVKVPVTPVKHIP